MVKLFTVDGLINPNIINNHIDNQENIVIIDDSKEYINEYYNTLKSKGYNVHILNFDDTKNSHGFDFLEYPYYLYKNKDLDKLADSLKAITETFSYKDEDPYWEKTSLSLIEGIIRVLFEDAKQSEINIRSIWNILEKSDVINDNSDPLKDYFQTKNKTQKSYICVSPTINAHPDTRLSVISLAKNSFKDLMTRDNLINVISGKDLSVMDFKKKKQAVFINIPKSTLIYNLFVPIFINQLFLFLTSNEYPKCNIIFRDLSNFDKFYNLNEMVKVRSDNINFEIATDYFTFKKYFNEGICLINQTYKNKPNKKFNKYPVTKQMDLNIFDFKTNTKPKAKKQMYTKTEIQNLIEKIDAEIEKIDREEDKKRN